MPIEPTSEPPEDSASGDLAQSARETYLLHLLASAATYRDRELDRRFEPLGLTVEKYRAMLAIARFTDCTMTELAQFTFIDRTTLTRMIDQLVTRGWVTRGHAPRDRRHVVLGLTPEGMAVGTRAVEELTAANIRAVTGASADQVETTIETLQMVLRNLIPDAHQLERILTMRRAQSGQT